MERRGDQRRRVVVDPLVERLYRAGGVLVGRGAQFGAALPGEGGEEHCVEVDRVELALRPDNQVLGLQIPVGRIVGDQLGGQRVEAPGQLPEAGRVAIRDGPVDCLAERRPLDPVGQHDIRPEPLVRGGVEEELPLVQPLSVDLAQVAHRPQEAAQDHPPAAAADAEDGGRVSDGVNGAPVRTAFGLQTVERPQQSVRIVEREEVLAEGVHRTRSVTEDGTVPKKVPSCRFGAGSSRPVRFSGSCSVRVRDPRSSRRRSRRRTNRRSSGPAGPRA